MLLLAPGATDRLNRIVAKGHFQYANIFTFHTISYAARRSPFSEFLATFLLQVTLRSPNHPLQSLIILSVSANLIGLGSARSHCATIVSTTMTSCGGPSPLPSIQTSVLSRLQAAVDGWWFPNLNQVMF
jgi:hypothetical protein